MDRRKHARVAFPCPLGALGRPRRRSSTLHGPDEKWKKREKKKKVQTREEPEKRIRVRSLPPTVCPRDTAVMLEGAARREMAKKGNGEKKKENEPFERELRKKAATADSSWLKCRILVECLVWRGVRAETDREENQKTSLHKAGAATLATRTRSLSVVP